MPSVLFVCSANQMRSPVAAALFEDLLRRRGLAAGWKIGSAGVWATDGAPASVLAQAAVKERGLDLSRHRSREVTEELLREFDLVLVMEAEQRDALAEAFPRFSSRVHRLAEMAGEARDVGDPLGGSPDRIHGTLDEIADLLERGWGQILANAVRNEQGRVGRFPGEGGSAEAS
jgi:protein-tyrosine-phosphatase